MFVGIDSSKDFFDFTILDGEKLLKYGQYKNDGNGFLKFLEEITSFNCERVIMEASGPYHLPLALFLTENSIKLSVINPLVIKRFSQMKMSRAKTDKKDSYLIAQFGQEQKPPIWKAPSEILAHMNHLNTYLESLEKRKTMVINQLHAFKASSRITIELESELMKEIEVYENRIKQTNAKLEELIKKEHGSIYSNLTSIPGIGSKSARLMIVNTNGFQDFESYKQVISYFGLAPRIFNSGSSVRGKSKICKMGMSSVRKTLYMAANSAIRFNKPCKALYERLRAKGKSHKQAMIASVNKLIKQAFAIAKSQKPYDPMLNFNHTNQNIILNL